MGEFTNTGMYDYLYIMGMDVGTCYLVFFSI